MDIRFTASKMIVEHGVFELSTLLLNLEVLGLFLEDKTAKEIAHEKSLTASTVRARADKASSLLCRFFETEEDKTQRTKRFEETGIFEPKTIAYLRKDTDRWLPVVKLTQELIMSMGITNNKDLNIVHRNIDVMEQFLGNTPRTSQLGTWYGRSNSNLTMIEKRMFYYVKMEASPTTMKVIDSFGDGDDYYLLFLRKWMWEKEPKWKEAAERWLKEYEQYKERYGYTTDAFEKIRTFYLDFDHQQKIHNAIELLETNGYTVTKNEI